MASTSYHPVKVETDDGVTLITLNRPEKRNAIDRETHDELDEALLAAGKDPATKAIVITGAGRAFCAGGDFGWFERRMKGETQPGEEPDINRGRSFLNIYVNVEKPVISAVNGDAIGLGATIALFSDIIIMSETARVGDTHVNVGLTAGDGGIIIWPLLTSLCRAKEMLITGKLLSAEEALHFGLANYVVPPDQLMPTAMDMARKLAKGPAKAISHTKIGLNKIIKDRLNLIMDACISMEMLDFQTKDHQEAVRAFMEKRPPRFTGE